MAVRIKNPYGVVVTVPEDKAERLLTTGFTKVTDRPKTVDKEQPAPRRRGRPKKTEN